MSEDERVRTLLAAAAEVPGLRPAPVETLIATGRGRVHRSRVLAAASAAVAIAAAATIPALISGHSAAAPPSSARSTAGSAEALAHGRWTELPNSPLSSAGSGPGGVISGWTGDELLVFRSAGDSGRLTGAAYVPGAGWHLTAPSPAIEGRLAIAGWAGADLVVGYAGRGTEISIAVYSPPTNSWAVSPALSPLLGGPDVYAQSQTPISVAGKIGNEVLLARQIHDVLYIYGYDVFTHIWYQRRYPLVPAVSDGVMKLAEAAGRLIVWWHWAAGHTSVHAITLDGAWRTVTGWPQSMPPFLVQYVGQGQILLTHQVQLGSALADAATASYIVNADSLRVRALPFAPQNPRPKFPGQEFQPALWTGSALIAFAWQGMPPMAGSTSFHYYVDAFDPASGRWYRLPSAPREMAVTDPVPPLWGGGQLFITNGYVLWSLRR